MTPEKGVETYCSMLFKQAGWLSYKMAQGGGVADRLFVSPRAFHLYVEFKRPGKTELDPAQLKWAIDMRARIREGLASASVHGPINSREQARRLLDRFKDA